MAKKTEYSRWNSIMRKLSVQMKKDEEIRKAKIAEKRKAKMESQKYVDKKFLVINVKSWKPHEQGILRLDFTNEMPVLLTEKVGEVLLGGILEGLIVAWILVQFDVDKICIDVLQPFINQCELTTSHFYFVFGVIGFIVGYIYEIHK